MCIIKVYHMCIDNVYHKVYQKVHHICNTKEIRETHLKLKQGIDRKYPTNLV